MTDYTLREARRFRRLRQSDLAAKSGVDQSTISGIETGRAFPSPDTRDKLARALHIAERRIAWHRPSLPSRGNGHRRESTEVAR
jgi:transcriptional regulator with XRE-family HTH domain